MFTLIPADFFDAATARETLSEVAGIGGDAEVKYAEIPQYDAVLIYDVSDGDSLPEMFSMLEKLPECVEYNKILASWRSGTLNLAIAQGKTLLLANEYPAPDFTTAEYYVFLALRSLQLNPEVSTIVWRNSLEAEDELSLLRYFKAVEQVCE